MRRATLVLAAALLPALLLASCGDDDDGDEAEAETVDVIATEYAFAGLPDEMGAGLLTISMDNQGAVDHEIAFVNIGEASNADTFFDDFAPVITEGGAWPDYVTTAIGANETGPGASGTFSYTLDEGTYMVFCALTGTPEDPDSEEAPPHFAQGMQQVVTVTAGDDDPELPDADGAIIARDYTFDVDLSAGDSVINFTNEGPNDHFAGFDRFPDGTTVEEAEATFATLVSLDEGEEPPEGTLESEEIGFSGIASEGKSIQFASSPLEAGTYVFYCFISDRAGGPPHAVGNEMYKAVVIE